MDGRDKDVSVGPFGISDESMMDRGITGFEVELGGGGSSMRFFSCRVYTLCET